MSLNIHEQLDLLYRIGEGDGANRPALSAGEEEAHRQVREWMDDAGLETTVDAVGNLYGRLVGKDPSAPEVWCGSHLDSVPQGGKFDGPLGVLAALHAVAGLDRQARTVTVVAFRDEEGWRFRGGFLGSRSVIGAITADDLMKTDADDVSVADALASLGYVLPLETSTTGAKPACYLEVHIEQGPVLAEAGAPLGVVTGIVGIAEGTVVFEGRAGHAGTTPMKLRPDAALCAAAFQSAAEQVAMRIEGAVVTFGMPAVVEPGAANVIARRVEVTFDSRAPDQARLDALTAGLCQAAQDVAVTRGCRASFQLDLSIKPVLCAEELQAAFGAAAPTAPRLPSGAGHDAQILGGAGIPVGMLFVRSLNGGVSHSPSEMTSDDDVDASVEALAKAIVSVASN
jgi:allantoate deiminase